MNKSPEEILDAVAQWIDDKNLLSHFQDKVIERCKLVEKRRKQHEAKVKKLLGGKTWEDFRTEHAKKILADEKLSNKDVCPQKDWLYDYRSFRECDVIDGSDSEKEKQVEGWWPPAPESGILPPFMYGEYHVDGYKIDPKEELLAAYLILAGYHDNAEGDSLPLIITEEMCASPPGRDLTTFCNHSRKKRKVWEYDSCIGACQWCKPSYLKTAYYLVKTDIAKEMSAHSVQVSTDDGFPPPPTDKWISNKKTSVILGLSKGRVTQLCDEKELLSEGSGKDRKISRMSALIYKAKIEQEESEKKVMKLGEGAMADNEDVIKDRTQMDKLL